jgi:hypothetical protein
MRRIAPALPMQRMLPLLPMLRIDPALPMLRTLKMLPTLPMLNRLPTPNEPARPLALPRDTLRFIPECAALRIRTPLVSTVSGNTAYRRNRLRSTYCYRTGCSLSTGSAGYFAFQASKPPSRADARKPILFSRRAARALVASSGQVQ